MELNKFPSRFKPEVKAEEPSTQALPIEKVREVRPIVGAWAKAAGYKKAKGGVFVKTVDGIVVAIYLQRSMHSAGAIHLDCEEDRGDSFAIYHWHCGARVEGLLNRPRPRISALDIDQSKLVIAKALDHISDRYLS